MKNYYFRKHARQIARIEIECHAEQDLFRPWEKLTQKQKDEFAKNGPIPCEGGGTPGAWCENCRFAVIQEPELLYS